MPGDYQRAMAPGAILSAGRLFLWERLSSSILAAEKPLPQGKMPACAEALHPAAAGFINKQLALFRRAWRVAWFLKIIDSKRLPFG
jgi:hypothetical protein